MKVIIRNARTDQSTGLLPPTLAVQLVDEAYQQRLARIRHKLLHEEGWDLEWKLVANDEQPGL